MTQQRTDDDRDATGESRDDRGRLMGVRVDGAWFYRHVPGIVQQLRDANGELVESLERATEARDAFKDERNGAVAEVRSLRGVVQAAQVKIAAVEALLPGTDEEFPIFPFQLREALGTEPGEFLLIPRAALAADADAPQPEPPKCCEYAGDSPRPIEMPMRCEHAKTEGHDAPGSDGDLYWCPGPSPAVLPETPETKDQR